MNNNNANKTSGSFNFNDVVKKIKTDPEGTPWFKKKVSIISMSSVLGAGALATVIAVPIALTSSSSTNNPNEAIAAFNKKLVTDKLNAYNTIMANTTNNTAIKEYFINQGGMSKFFDENVEPITEPDVSGSESKATYDNFKAFLPTYKNSTTVTYTPADGTNFLKIKAIATKDSSGNTINTDVSTNNTNIYCQQSQNLSTNIGRYIFYSPIVNEIQNVTMNSDFSITMSLSTDNKVTNTAFQVTDTSFKQHYIPYKTTIKFSNTTLFPGMSKFVKTNILNLTA